MDRIPGRILVVEDDPDAALFLVHVLTRRGRFDVTHTPDPAEALSLAVDGSWDLVITDLEMPAMTGLELLDALRSLTPRLPVVLVSASLPHPPVTAPGGSRPDEVLAKPVPVERLLAIVTALIGSGQARGEEEEPA